MSWLFLPLSVGRESPIALPRGHLPPASICPCRQHPGSPHQEAPHSRWLTSSLVTFGSCLWPQHFPGAPGFLQGQLRKEKAQLFPTPSLPTFSTSQVMRAPPGPATPQGQLGSQAQGPPCTSPSCLGLAQPRESAPIPLRFQPRSFVHSQGLSSPKGLGELLKNKSQEAPAFILLSALHIFLSSQRLGVEGPRRRKEREK